MVNQAITEACFRSAVLQINHQQRERKVEAFCSFCVDLAAPIVEYISNNMTQEELTSALHQLCSFTFFHKNEVTVDLGLQAAIIDYDC